MKRVGWRWRAFTLTVAGCALGWSCIAAADVKSGVDAWAAGDFARAVQEWSASAAMGDPDAQFNLAQAYRLGRGVSVDIKQAETLYAKAAAQGHPRAADNYGILLYQDGRRAQAMPLLVTAAERGDPRAQYLVGLAHFNGDLATRDWRRAYAMMTLANMAKLPAAGAALTRMDEYIPAEDRQASVAIAVALKARSVSLREGDRVDAELAMGRPAGSPPVVTVTSAAARGAWKIQLGAFAVSGNAERLWKEIGRHPALSAATRQEFQSGRLTFLFAAGFASEAAAKKACDALKASGRTCLVTH